MSVRYVRATRKLGEYEMTLVERLDASANGGDDQAGYKHTPIEFDGSIAAEGWNHLGDFDLQSPHVALVVTDQTDGEVVVADAIRWRPLAGQGVAGRQAQGG